MKCIALTLAVVAFGCASGQQEAEAPKAEPEPEQTSEPKELTPMQVQQTIKASLDDFALCAQTSWANAKGQVAVKARFVVQPDGKASDVTFEDPPQDAMDLVECVKQTTLGLTFPKAAGPTDAHYPFYFEPM